MKHYSITETDGSMANDCGSVAWSELPERIKQAIKADPTAGEWVLPALSDGDHGEELLDLQVVVTVG